MINTFLGKLFFIGLVLSFSFVRPAHCADLEQGKAKFSLLCASCHGATGAGDGPVVLSLPESARPQGFSKPFKYATDYNKFKELLQKGGAAVGLSALMPPQTTLSPSDLENLWAFIQKLK